MGGWAARMVELVGRTVLGPYPTGLISPAFQSLQETLFPGRLLAKYLQGCPGLCLCESSFSVCKSLGEHKLRVCVVWETRRGVGR